MAEEVVDRATGALPVLDESGQPRPLHTLWSSRGTAVIAFLRHFG